MIKAITSLEFLISLLILFLILHTILIFIDIISWIRSLKRDKNSKCKTKNIHLNDDGKRI